MISLYLWNRNQSEKYRKALSEKIDRLVSPDEFPENSASDLQKFYLDYKNRAIQFVNEATEWHKKELQTSDNSHLLLLKQTALVDVVVQASLRTAIWLYNKTHGRSLREQDVPIAIAARGGYGREEMYFCSDVDIQIVSQALPQGETRETAGKIVNYFEYLFIHQDIFRTASSFGYSEMDEAGQKFDARKMAAFYSLLEHRLVAGDARVYNEFKSSIKTAALAHKDEVLAHCLQNKTCYDVQNTVFQQEPNVKDELRRLYWALSLARWRYSLEKNNQFELLQELFSREKLSAPAFKNLRNALNFLSRVRLFLHCHQKGYQRDLLSYEVREKIAESMNYDLKRFFHEYFYNAVYPMKRYSRNLFWESLTFDEQSVKNLHEDFAVNADNQIVCKKDPEEAIAGRPELIFKILSWVAEEGCNPSYPIIRAIENNVDQMCPIFLADEKSEEALSYFKAVVEGRYFSRALRLLHEFGLLAHYYIPEFKNLCGLLQDIYVHLFPTDVHVLSALDELNKLEINKDIDPFLRELYESVKDKTALKLSVLLHDIGKGLKKEGEDEEMAGSRAIPRILENLGYGGDPRRIQDVAFLVERHLTMRDLLLLDPDQDDTYDMIWDLVYHDKERLKMLILLTYSDRGGTKMRMSASQIEQLKLFYQNTLHHKKRSSAGNAVKLEFLDMIRLPRDLQLQLEIYNEFIESSAGFSCDMFLKTGQASELVVCAKDYKGLLFHIAAVLAFNQLSIVDANVHTLEDKAFDVFKVMNSSGNPIEYANFFFVQKQVKEDLRRIFVGGEPIYEVYKGRTLPARADAGKYKDVKLKMKFIGRAIKLETHDVLGTFMMETKVLSDLGMEIQRAVLHTHQGIADNVFYLNPQDVERIHNKKEKFQSRIREALAQLLNPDPIFLEEKAAID